MKDTEEQNTLEQSENIFKKVNKFFEDNKKVTLTFYKGKERNGFILQMFKDLFLFLDDKIQNMPVFYSELKDIELYITLKKR
jgi:hypothetical protein